MPRRKLLLVVGAGASLEFGMPPVAGVRAMINDAIQVRYPLLAEPATNLYEHVEGLVRTHWQRTVPEFLRREPHYEDLLYAIFAVAAAYPAGAATSALGAVVTAKGMPDVSLFGRHATPVGPDTLRDLGRASVDAVVEAFRERCAASEADKASEFARLQVLVAALQAEFDVAVVTLNYDNVMYRAFPGIETGFDPATGIFDQERILRRSGWACMLHLHGSVHFDMQPGPTGDMHEIRWQPDIRGRFHQNAGGRSTRSHVEGIDFPTSVIVAGYGKTTQILKRPFRTYYSELDRLVAGCDAVLFAGYGFGDEHLTVAFEGFRDARNRPVAIIDFARDDAMTMGGADLGGPNAMVDEMVRTFLTEPRTMRALGYSAPQTVADLRAAQEFETCLDPATPLAIWYNGMLAACDAPSKVLARLA